MKIVSPDCPFSFFNVTPAAGALPDDSGTRSGSSRRPAARAALCFSGSYQDKDSAKNARTFFRLPPEKAGLGAWKPDPLALEGAPNHREITYGATPMQTNRNDQLSVPTNTVLHGDCISIMHSLPANSIDFILTDPPYLVRYQDREGRSIPNDSNSDWLVPAFSEAYRVLKQDHFMISFYGWTQVDKFFHAWRSAGFRIVGHLVFRKQYASKSRFLKYQHEQALPAGKGQSNFAGESDLRCICHALLGQQASSHTEAGGCAEAADRSLHSEERSGPRSVLWFGLNSPGIEDPQPPLPRHRTRYSIPCSR